MYLFSCVLLTSLLICSCGYTVNLVSYDSYSDIETNDLLDSVPPRTIGPMPRQVKLCLCPDELVIHKNGINNEILDEYYIMDGRICDTYGFNWAWVRANCSIKERYVYEIVRDPSLIH